MRIKMKPTEKSQEIENLLTNLSGISRQDAARMGICTWCKQPILANSFRDSLSKREWSISGFCQKCQDETFGQ